MKVSDELLKIANELKKYEAAEDGEKIPLALGINSPLGGYAVDKGDFYEFYLPKEDAVDGYEVDDKTGEYPVDMEKAEAAEAFKKTTGRTPKSEIYVGSNDDFEGGYIVTWNPNDVVFWKKVKKDDPDIESKWLKQYGYLSYYHDNIYKDLKKAGHWGWGAIAINQ